MQEAKQETMTKEELAYLIKILWEALQTPSWIKDDMIEFGKAIYGKTQLKDLDPKRFNQLFPHLKTIAEHLGIKLKEAILPAPPPAMSQQNAPTPNPAPAPTQQDEKCNVTTVSDTPHTE